MALSKDVRSALSGALNEYAGVSPATRETKIWHIIVASKAERADAEAELAALRPTIKLPLDWDFKFGDDLRDRQRVLAALACPAEEIARLADPGAARIRFHVDAAKTSGPFYRICPVGPGYPEVIDQAVSRAFRFPPKVSWVIVVHTAMQKVLAERDVRHRRYELGEVGCPGSHHLVFVIDPASVLGSVEERRGEH